MSAEQTAQLLHEVLARLDQLESLSKLNYAKGVWTPAFQGATTPGSFTYTAQQGRYTRIGNIVIARARLIIATIPSAPSGGMRIAGLPYTVANVNAPGDCAIGRLSSYNYSAGALELTGQPVANQTYIQLLETFDAGATTGAPAGGFPAGVDISLTCIYEAA